MVRVVSRVRWSVVSGAALSIRGSVLALERVIDDNNFPLSIIDLNSMILASLLSHDF